MTPRAIRRAAERKAAKLAAKTARQQTTTTTLPAEAQQTKATAATVDASTLITNAFDFTDEEDDALSLHAEKSFAATASGETVEPAQQQPEQQPTKPPISDARLAANKANASHSTGAKTTAGKLKVSLNALKTGLTSQVVVMPHEDAAAYKDYLDRRFKKFSPANDDENILVQAIVDNEWRLARVPSLEAGIYAIGQLEFAAEFAEEENAVNRAALIRAKTAIHYRKDLSNQALQERRLRSHIEKDLAKLAELQKERQAKRYRQIDYCLKLKDREGPNFQTEDVGFDFSLTEFDAFLAANVTRFRLSATRSDLDMFLNTFRKQQQEAQAA